MPKNEQELPKRGNKKNAGLLDIDNGFRAGPEAAQGQDKANENKNDDGKLKFAGPHHVVLQMALVVALQANLY